MIETMLPSRNKQIKVLDPISYDLVWRAKTYYSSIHRLQHQWLLIHLFQLYLFSHSLSF